MFPHLFGYMGDDVALVGDDAAALPAAVHDGVRPLADQAGVRLHQVRKQLREDFHWNRNVIFYFQS